MASVVYPAIVERAGSGFSVFFPDLPGCTSAGETLQDAVLNAEQALAGHLLVTVRHNEEVSDPSHLDDIERDPEIDEVARVLVRAEKPGKAVRINITLDEGLVAAIDRRASNRSGFLAEAARRALADA
ncbi:MAG: type II toxin-antitoxin system HicB family antitoxin [Sphingomonas sp.]|uniref:type II toxin-antitoxin system HicB family antitoxin n=1 Tax=Sphingomonas sp. TaxID=28214 RepID=UPI002276569B|nr:type II toxin-antitoxin system HicB family antitoxin [Sphingomonas sp.]MCX8475398.1 type II toxin-antitoxin system HicB family antitoxin [Sphingomonas sp.]